MVAFERHVRPCVLVWHQPWVVATGCRLLTMQHYRSRTQGPPWSAWQLVSYASSAVSCASLPSILDTASVEDKR